MYLLMNIQVYMYVRIHMFEGQRLMLGAFLSFSSYYFLRPRFLTWTWNSPTDQTGPAGFWALPALSAPAQGCRCAYNAEVFQSSEDSDSGPHACTTSASPTELSPEPQHATFCAQSVIVTSNQLSAQRLSLSCPWKSPSGCRSLSVSLVASAEKETWLKVHLRAIGTVPSAKVVCFILYWTGNVGIGVISYCDIRIWG